MLKLTALQYAPPNHDPKAALDAARAQLGALPQSGGPGLVVLPELANSGYVVPDRETLLRSAEPASGGPFLDTLAVWAQSAGQAVVAGFAERAGDLVFNAAALLRPDGTRAIYRKLHLFDTEKQWFAPGDEGPMVHEVFGTKIGMAICFDWQFPEYWRALSLLGASVVAHPSNLVLPGLCQRAMPVHAMLNRFFIVTANRIGTEAALRFTGRSILCGVRGQVLAEGAEDAPGVLTCAVDPAEARDKSVGSGNDLIADRRPWAYERLMKA